MSIAAASSQHVRLASASPEIDVEEMGEEDETYLAAAIHSRLDHLEVPLRTTSPEEIEPLESSPPDGPPTPPPKPSIWKGKGKATYHEELDEGERKGLDTRGTEDPFREDSVQEHMGMYPPSTEGTLEERRVTEHLKRWELMEKARRKAARDSRISMMSGDVPSHPHGHSQSTNVVRRGSLFWSSKQRKPGPGSHRLPSDGNEDDPDVPEAETPDTPTTTAAAARIIKPMPRRRDRHSHTFSHSSQDSSASVSSTATITPISQFLEPTSLSRSPSQSSNPFRDPRPLEPTPSNGPFMSSTSQNPFDSIPRTSSPEAQEQELRNITSGKGGRVFDRLPTPAPLGLPARPGTARLPSSMSQMSKGRRGEDEDEVEPPFEGRWWTDWLCGCREGPDRGGDHQAGRTNAFE